MEKLKWTTDCTGAELFCGTIGDNVLCNEDYQSNGRLDAGEHYKVTDVSPGKTSIKVANQTRWFGIRRFSRLHQVSEKEDPEKFKAGDTVECVKPHNASNPRYELDMGKHYKVKRCETYYCYLEEMGGGWDKDRFIKVKALQPINKNTLVCWDEVDPKQEGEQMNINIAKNFGKTEDALLVEKHLGIHIGVNFIAGLVISSNTDAILTEAKRLEKAEQVKNKCQ